MTDQYSHCDLVRMATRYFWYKRIIKYRTVFERYCYKVPNTVNTVVIFSAVADSVDCGTGSTSMHIRCQIANCPCTMGWTFDDIWKFFTRLSERHKTVNGKATNYFIAQCKACVEHCSQEERHEFSSTVYKLIGRKDMFIPHIKSCCYIDPDGRNAFLTSRSQSETATLTNTSSLVQSRKRSRTSLDESDVAAVCEKYQIDRATFNAIYKLLLNIEATQHTLRLKAQRDNSGLNGWVVPVLTKAQVNELEEALLVMIADAALPFAFVERESFLDVVQILRASAVKSIPSVGWR